MTYTDIVLVVVAIVLLFSGFLVFLGLRIPDDWGGQDEPDPVQIKSIEERMRDAQC